MTRRFDNHNAMCYSEDNAMRHPFSPVLPMNASSSSNGTPPAESSSSRNPVTAGVESTLRAMMGLFAISREEVEAIVQQMVERGELAEKDGKRILSHLFERPKQGVRRINRHVETTVDETMNQVLAALNIPTRSDLQTLSEKINELAEKVDKLSKKVSS